MWAIHTAGRVVEESGALPASVVDSRTSGWSTVPPGNYFTAAAYLVFYTRCRRPAGDHRGEECGLRCYGAKTPAAGDVMGRSTGGGHLPGAE